ncbi:ATP-binding protein [Streptomyces sp. NRRL WC-3742]|uniref:ATP-binding protein n=1 Tax=Streptomyces sp. NRRL WC-3742 TaxID=1463934 RepID=UPI003B632668
MRFAAVRETVGDVRRWARKALPELGLHLDEDPLSDVLLALSELVGNAVVHGCGGDCPEVLLTVALVPLPGGGLRVEVSDPSTIRPELRDADDEATSGRGLALVAAVAARFGADGLGEGKRVWAEFDFDGEPHSSTATSGTAVVPVPVPVPVPVAATVHADAVRVLMPRPVDGSPPSRRTVTYRRHEHLDPGGGPDTRAGHHRTPSTHPDRGGKAEEQRLLLAYGSPPAGPRRASSAGPRPCRTSVWWTGPAPLLGSPCWRNLDCPRGGPGRPTRPPTP